MSTYLFIILSQTGTRVAQMIKKVTRKPYNHASIAVDLTLEEMYSFCRTYRYLLLPATFNQEIVGKGTLGQFLTIPCEIYAIPVSQDVKDDFLQYLNHFKACRKQYSYNVLGLWTTFFHIRWTRRNKLHCSEFVARMLDRCGIQLEKQPSLYTPDDLRYLPGAFLVYRGELNRFYAMERPELVEILEEAMAEKIVS